MSSPASQIPSSANGPATGRSSPSWGKRGEPGSAFNTQARTPRGHPNRSRNGGRNRNNQSKDETPSTTNSLDRSTLPPKPSLSVTSPTNLVPVNNRSKNPSRRPSRSNSSANTAQSSPVESPVTPSSSRSSNRRRRPAKGNQIPHITVPTNNTSANSGRSRTGTLTGSNAPKDLPPHLAPKSSQASTTSFDVNKNIDALVERVRAVAMAENRPSTPGSHIDWAGDDDDSLPDLDDWGIPSFSEHKFQTISPIALGALKPLPEHDAYLINISGGDQAAEKNSTSISSRLAEGDRTAKASLSASQGGNNQESIEKSDLEVTDATGEQSIEIALNKIGSGGLSQSIHAPRAEEKEGLMASIHAPRAMAESNSAPADLNGRSPRTRNTHVRAQTVGRPSGHSDFVENLAHRSPRMGRAGPRGSPRQHARNHSSPSSTTSNTHRPPHSRPVLTGDALSRIAKTIGGGKTPTAKPAPVAND